MKGSIYDFIETKVRGSTIIFGLLPFSIRPHCALFTNFSKALNIKDPILKREYEVETWQIISILFE